MSLFAENVFISANFIENKANRRKICCPGKREAGQFIIPLYISTSDGLAGVWRVGACGGVCGVRGAPWGAGACAGVPSGRGGVAGRGLPAGAARWRGGMCAEGCGGVRRVAGLSVVAGGAEVPVRAVLTSGVAGGDVRRGGRGLPWGAVRAGCPTFGRDVRCGVRGAPCDGAFRASRRGRKVRCGCAPRGAVLVSGIRRVGAGLRSGVCLRVLPDGGVGSGGVRRCGVGGGRIVRAILLKHI